MITFPIFSIITFISGLKKLKFSLNLSDNLLESGDTFSIGINTSNNSIITYLKAKVITKFENSYYGFSSQLTSVIPIRAKNDFLHNISFDVSRLGIINVSCVSIEVEDICGFLCAVYNPGLCDSVTVIPQRIVLEDNVYTGLLSGYSENEDETQKGNEYSDTSNIREYVPGDRIKDIHWKLSAKKDILLVKERIKSCENQLVICFDSSSNPVLNDKILMLLYCIICHCIDEGVLIKVYYYDFYLKKISSHTVNSVNDCYECFNAIYKSGCGIKINDINEMLALESEKITNYAVVGYYDDEIKVVIHDGT